MINEQMKILSHKKVPRTGPYLEGGGHWAMRPPQEPKFYFILYAGKKSADKFSKKQGWPPSSLEQFPDMALTKNNLPVATFVEPSRKESTETIFVKGRKMLLGDLLHVELKRQKLLVNERHHKHDKVQLCQSL